MNSFIGMGRLTREVDFKVLQTVSGELPVSRYTLAIDRKGKKDEADFIPCVCFGKTAEFAHKHLNKGMKIAITGRIQTGSYEKDGNKIYTWDVYVENHEFCERKKADGESTPAPDDLINIPEDIAEEMPFGKN